MPEPWHSMPMRALTVALFLLTTPALADVTGPARVIDGDRQARRSTFRARSGSR